MKVLFVHPGLCARAWKEALALKENGIEVHLATYSLKVANKGLYDLSVFKSVSKIPAPRKIIFIIASSRKFEKIAKTRVVQRIGKAVIDKYVIERPSKAIKKLANKLKIDLIHAHNAPDYPCVSAIRANIAPVIFDTHDFLTPDGISLKIFGSGTNLISEWEKTANQRSDGNIYQSKESLDWAKQTYGINEDNTAIYQNLAQYYVSDNVKKLSENDGKTHLVFQGSIGKPAPNDELCLFKELIKQGYVVHAYLVSDNDENFKKYQMFNEQNEDFHLHKPIPAEKMPKELSRYDWSLVPQIYSKDSFINWDTPFLIGAIKPSRDLAIPNKLFESLAAGTPVAAINTKGIKRMVEFYNGGFVFNNMNELINGLQNKPPLIHPEKRKEFISNSQIDKIISLYYMIEKQRD